MRIGFRTWSLVEREGKFNFNSVSMQRFTWALKGENKTDKPIPNVNSVGFYHYYDPGPVQKEYGGKGLLGACMCWGHISGKEVKERMFRAEYSWILAVTMPDWNQFPPPSEPQMPPSLSNRLWMAAVSKNRADLLNTEVSFKQYVEALSLVLGIDPSALNIQQMHTNFQSNRNAVERQLERYQQAVVDWKNSLENWPTNQAARFKEQMPFPVFGSVPELVAYAQEFGDLGPPDRSAPKARPNWWENLSPAP